MDHGDLSTGRVTTDVALETPDRIHGRKRHAKAVETREGLHQSTGFEVAHAAEKDFPAAVDLF